MALMSRNLFSIGVLIVPNRRPPERMMESIYREVRLEMERPLREVKVHDRRARKGNAAKERMTVFSCRLEGLKTPMGAILIIVT
jgi:hypothetical protein